MEKDQNSISIINRSGGTVTGENTGALPIKLITGLNLSTTKIFILGFITAVALMIFLVSTVKRQVVVVEVAGKASDYKEYKLK